MPFGSEGLDPGIGLAMSGGGCRATLFHCGSLWRLNEFGYLPRLRRVSSVSGGSLTAGVLGARWTRLRFVNGVAENLVDEVILPLRRFAERSIDTPAVIKGVLLPGKTIADAVQDAFEELLGPGDLQSLPDEPPRFIFNATNLATGVDFRFSKPYAGDSASRPSGSVSRPSSSATPALPSPSPPGPPETGSARASGSSTSR